MAKFVTNLCRQVLLDRGGDLGSVEAFQSLSVDDSNTLGSASTTTLGSPTNLAVDDFDSISRSGQTLTVTASFAAGVANFTHKRLIVHNLAAASVTGTSASVMYGHDQQTNQKNSSTSLTYTVELIAA